MGAYKHSYLMAKLKGTAESIKENYSSEQYAQTLDTLFYSAVEPIINTTNIADIVIADLLHFSMENHKRKVSVLNKQELLTGIFIFLASPVEQKLLALKNLRLEKSILRCMINIFLDKTEKYQQLQIVRCTEDRKELLNITKQIEDSVQLQEGEDLFSAINTVKFWYGKAKHFKEQILEKYYRLIVTEAQSFYAMNPSNNNLDDVIQDFVWTTTKALDKYDSSQGTLTSYIKTWFQHARTTAANNADNYLPESLSENCFISLDSETLKNLPDENELDIESLDVQKRVQLLAKIADPIGLGRLSFGISEIFTENEKRIQSLS